MKGYEGKFDFKWIYSKRTEEQIKEVLVFAEESHRVKVNEWRNFIDYDIIPLIRKLIEKNPTKLKTKR